MLSSHSSTGSNQRRGTKRRRSPGSHCTADSTGSLGRQVRQCVQEGRWPNHPLAEANTTPPDLLTYSLHLGLCGISEREVRELGLWAYLQSYEVHNPLAREEAQAVVDTKLASADMYQHLSYFGKVLPCSAFFNMLDLLRHRMHARKQDEGTKAEPPAATPEQEVNRSLSPGCLSELFAEFLEQHAQRTCRVAERRMRCIQLRQALRDAESAESYPQVIYTHLWRKEQGPWSRFIHERDIEALWMPL